MKLIYILLTLFFVFSVQAETMQKRLYKKRNNKVQINAGKLHFSETMDISGNLQASYSRNFGHFEIGALLGFSDMKLNLTDLDNVLKKSGLLAGLIIEGNFINNKRRSNWIPSGGLKIIYMASDLAFDNKERDNGIYVNPFLSSKHFISSRTSINLELEWPVKVWEWDMEDLWRGLDFSFGYAYYFH